MRHEGPLFRSLKCCPPAKHAKLGVKPRKFVRRCPRIGSDRAVAKVELRTHRMPPGRAHTANPGTAQGALAARGSEEPTPPGALAVRTENRNEGYPSRRKVFRLAYPNQSSEPATISTR